MNKIILRYLIIVLIAVAVGALIYHLNQPNGAISLASSMNSVGSFSGDLGGRHDFGEGSFGLASGLFGIGGNLFQVAIITFLVVSVRKLFVQRPQPVRAR
jgi:hypothetical protein